MSFNFYKTTIGEQVTLQRGFDITKKDQVEGNIPVVSSGGISSYHNEAKVSGPGVVLGRKGSLGTVFYIDGPYWPHDTTLWVKDFKNNNPIFIYYFFKNISQLLKDMDVGAANPALNRNHVHPLEILWPNRKTQDHIAGILASLDAKINNNTKVNKTLEQMAQALFKSWFVDFEPVKAKIAVLEAGGSQEDATLVAMTAISGKNADSLVVFEREQPEQYAELKATAELFPSAMQESELGDIPAGWSSQRMSNIATLHYGKALKKTERIDGPYPVYGSGGITGSHDAYLVEGPGIIVGRKGSIGTIYWEDGKFHPIDTVYYVTTKEEIPLSYLYYLMKTLNLPSMNTDAAVPGLNRDNVYRLEVLKPTQSILNRFDNHIATIRNGIQKNNNTIVSLVGLRDTLLPKLLSGEIPLPKTEEIAKEADYV